MLQIRGAVVVVQASPAKTYVMEMTSPALPEARWTCSSIVGEACQPLQARYLGVRFQGWEGLLCMAVPRALFKGLRALLWQTVWQIIMRQEHVVDAAIVSGLYCAGWAFCV